METSMEVEEPKSPSTVTMNSEESESGELSPPEAEMATEEIKIGKKPKKPAFDWDLYLDRNEVLLKMRQNREFIDLILVDEAGQTEEQCHLAIVSTLGKCFTDFVLEKSKECQGRQKRVALPGVSQKALQRIIESTYTGRLSLNSDSVWQIMSTAELYQMNSIVQACCTFLIYELNIHNCVTFLSLGNKNNHPLKYAAWNLMLAKFHAVMSFSNRNMLTYK